MIYFLLNRVRNAVKIGSAVDVPRRLSQLQIGSPDPLELLGTSPGSLQEERELHQHFRCFHIRGEWFEAHPDLLAELPFVASPLATVSDHPSLLVRAGKPILANAWRVLVGQVRQHGRLAFSLLGPHGDSTDSIIKNLAFWIFRTAGQEGMRLVFDAVEEWVSQNCPADAGILMSCLDHRFHGVGGWYA